MNKEEYEDFVLRYKGCGACFPLYHKLSRFEKMWFTAIQKDVAELEEENAELKNKDCWKSCEYANSKAELIEQHIKDVQKLTKAKEIIKLLLWDLRNHSYNPEKDMSRAEEFLGRAGTQSERKKVEAYKICDNNCVYCRYNCNCSTLVEVE